MYNHYLYRHQYHTQIFQNREQHGFTVKKLKPKITHYIVTKDHIAMHMILFSEGFSFKLLLSLSENNCLCE